MTMNDTLYYRKKKINRQKQIVLQCKYKKLSEVSSIPSDKKATKFPILIYLFSNTNETM